MKNVFIEIPSTKIINGLLWDFIISMSQSVSHSVIDSDKVKLYLNLSSN